MFSLCSTYISLSSLSLPSPKMRKANESCMVSALVKQSSYGLFRFSSCRYVTKGEIFIGRPPLRENTNIREGAFIPEGKFAVSSGKMAMFHNVVAQR